MAQIAALAQNLSGQNGQSAESGQNTPGTQSGEASGTAAPSPAAPLPEGFDPELLRRFAPVLSQLNRPESSQASAFLEALRPFLSEARREKVSEAARLARLIHLAKTFLTT